MLIQSLLQPPSIPMPQWNISIISLAETPVSEQALKVMEGVYKVGFLFVYDGVHGSDVFEMAVCLVGTV